MFGAVRRDRRGRADARRRRGRADARGPGTRRGAAGVDAGVVERYRESGEGGGAERVNRVSRSRPWRGLGLGNF